MTKKRFLTAGDMDDVMNEISSIYNDIENISIAWDDIQNLPNLHNISLTGHWNDLIGSPTFHNVSFTGSYTDLSDLPELPEAIDLDPFIERIEDLEVWAARKVAAIPSITTTVTADAVKLLGINLPTANSFTALVDAHNALKNSHNSLINACKTWGWMEL